VSIERLALSTMSGSALVEWMGVSMCEMAVRTRMTRSLSHRVGCRVRVLFTTGSTVLREDAANLGCRRQTHFMGKAVSPEFHVSEGVIRAFSRLTY
jgi:hypothetical protein